MNLAKLFAIAFCGAALLVQAYMVVTPLRRKNAYQNYYWPFVNYPMYSDSHRMGESFSTLDLRVVPCGPDAKPVQVRSTQLRVKWKPYEQMIFQAARLRDTNSTAPAERAARHLRHYVATRLSFPACTVQLWSQTFRIGPHGLEPPDTTWRVAAEWDLTPADSVTPQVSAKR
jgi:hypothetical protein